jgi:hypothetical protein
VLKSGILRYYKISGPEKINIRALFDHLRGCGQLLVVGASTGILEAKHCRNGNGSSMPAPGAPVPEPPVASAEFSMQVATVTDSEDDARRFFITVNKQTLDLIAETRLALHFRASSTCM